MQSQKKNELTADQIGEIIANALLSGGVISPFGKNVIHNILKDPKDYLLIRRLTNQLSI